MAAAKHDHERKEFPAATADLSFRDPVLPGTVVSDATRLDTHRLDRVHDKWIEDGIAVENEILWRGDLKPRGGVRDECQCPSITCCFHSRMNNGEGQEPRP